MIEAAILESVIKVVDRLTDLLKYRHGRRKELFTAIIEPLFNDLLTMHADYMKMFDDCSQQLSHNEVPIQQIAELLRQRRQVYEGLRIKSRAIINSLATADFEPEAKSFLEAAAYHIPDGRLGPIMSTPSGMLLSRLYKSSGILIDTPPSAVNSRNSDRAALRDLVVTTTNETRSRWGSICEEYIRVKMWALR